MQCGFPLQIPLSCHYNAFICIAQAKPRLFYVHLCHIITFIFQQIFFFLCLFTGVCVNFCSFAHYSGVKLVLSSQDLFMSAKLNTFHAIMQNYVIFFTGILITSQNKTYSVRLIIKNSKFYTWKSLWGLNDSPPFWKPPISANYPFVGYLRTEHWYIILVLNNENI